MIPLKNKNFFLIVFTSCISITTYAQDFTVDILGIQYEYKYDAREKKFTICASTKKNALFCKEFLLKKEVPLLLIQEMTDATRKFVKENKKDFFLSSSFKDELNTTSPT